MNKTKHQELSSDELIKSVIQKIATGPTQSKNISREEAKQCMLNILDNKIDEVRSSIFLIALRMKRETDNENLGIHDAIIETTKTIDISLDHLINIADPYDGFTRHIPSSAFIPPVLAELGYPTISHGLESVGPKYGCTHHQTYAELGLNPKLNHEQNIERLLNKKIGWAYIDQCQFNKKLFNLMSLRKKIIKRPAITTVEVLVKPIAAKKNYFVTGYVHKAYPPIYLKLARNAGFNSSMVIKGTEGGIIPSLSQPSKIFSYKNINDEDVSSEYDPKKDCEIDQSIRAVEIPKNASITSAVDKIESKIQPKDIAKESVKQGIEALKGKEGSMKDCIAYGASIIFSKISGYDIHKSNNEIKKVLDSGSAFERINHE